MSRVPAVGLKEAAGAIDSLQPYGSEAGNSNGEAKTIGINWQG
jgi:hypothetical protein